MSLSNEAQVILDRVEALLKRDEQWIADNIHAAISALEHGVSGGQDKPADPVVTGLTAGAQEPVPVPADSNVDAEDANAAPQTLDPGSLVPDEHKE